MRQLETVSGVDGTASLITANLPVASRGGMEYCYEVRLARLLAGANRKVKLEVRKKW